MRLQKQQQQQQKKKLVVERSPLEVRAQDPEVWKQRQEKKKKDRTGARAGAFFLLFFSL